MVEIVVRWVVRSNTPGGPFQLIVKDRAMLYPVCGIKDPLLLFGKPAPMYGALCVKLVWCAHI